MIGLAQQRPVLGWGWVSYWPPWVPPFDDLISRNGVQVMHAHNAWLDVWLQLGIVGLIVVGALVLSTFVRAWLFAVDPPQVWQATRPIHSAQPAARAAAGRAAGAERCREPAARRVRLEHPRAGSDQDTHGLGGTGGRMSRSRRARRSPPHARCWHRRGSRPQRRPRRSASECWPPRWNAPSAS